MQRDNLSTVMQLKLARWRNGNRSIDKAVSMLINLYLLVMEKQLKRNCDLQLPAVEKPARSREFLTIITTLVTKRGSGRRGMRKRLKQNKVQDSTFHIHSDTTAQKEVYLNVISVGTALACIVFYRSNTGIVFSNLIRAYIYLPLYIIYVPHTGKAFVTVHLHQIRSRG
jgi:hypothetical protein